MNRKEWNRLRYASNYEATTASRARSAVNLLTRLGCTVTLPAADDFAAAIRDYAANCPRRQRIDWDD